MDKYQKYLIGMYIGIMLGAALVHLGNFSSAFSIGFSFGKAWTSLIRPLVQNGENYTCYPDAEWPPVPANH